MELKAKQIFVRYKEEPMADKDKDRRKNPSEKKDIDRRKGSDRRENIVGRGRFDQYVNLYNILYNSKGVSEEAKEIFRQIMPDEEWQIRFVQEVSMDKMFLRRKSKNELREFFIKYGALEAVADSSDQAQNKAS